MQKFTIRDIENMCDIKAHTLRVWEQRYPFFSPKRIEGKHRYYENEDLKRLLRIAFLYHHGWKISKIAALSDDQIITAVRDLENVSRIEQHFILTLIRAALDFDEQVFSYELDALIRRFGLEDTISKVCYPFLKRIGILWMSNPIKPAQEHFATHLIQHKIIAETDKLPYKPANKPTIILYTPDDKYHELPMLFIHYLLRKWGWTTIYLGANSKLQQLKEVANHDAVGYVYTHIVTDFSRFEIDDYFELLCKTLPNKTIVASGACTQDATRSFVNLMLLKSDEAIYSFIKG